MKRWRVSIVCQLATGVSVKQITFYYFKKIKLFSSSLDNGFRLFYAICGIFIGTKLHNIWDYASFGYFNSLNKVNILNLVLTMSEVVDVDYTQVFLVSGIPHGWAT